MSEQDILSKINELESKLNNLVDTDARRGFMNMPTVWATSEFVDIVPVGTIVLYDDSLDIPEGWALCDGTLGTPDLQSLFIP